LLEASRTIGKRRYRRKKASLEARIKEYPEKIAQEQRKAIPDVRLIRHWEREIAAFQSGIERTQKRLGEKAWAQSNDG
jgi:hypothetical protein